MKKHPSTQLSNLGKTGGNNKWGWNNRKLNQENGQLFLGGEKFYSID
jgi:hypothetical protein